MSIFPVEIEPPPRIEDWKKWARTVGLRIGDDERVLFDDDAELAQRFRDTVAQEFAQSLPDPHYSGWRVILALLLAFFTLSIVVALVGVIRDGTAWGSYIATSVVILLLDCTWIVSQRKWSARVDERDDLRAHLTEHAARSAMEVIRARRIRTKTRSPEGEVAPRFDAAWPAPSPQPYGVSDDGARALVSEWLRHLGAIDTVPTQVGNHGGVDAHSSRYIVHTKNSNGTVGIAEVRELAGVCVADGRRGIIFTSDSFAANAVEFADRVGITLFIYSAEGGTLTAANPNAQLILTQGL